MKEGTIPEIGNTTGLKRQQHDSIERLYRASFGPAPEVFIPQTLATRMAGIARELNRQIGVLVDRRGQITTPSSVMHTGYSFQTSPDTEPVRAGSGSSPPSHSP